MDDSLQLRRDDSLSRTSAPPLVGRDRETRAVRDLVDGFADHGAALVVRGEAGIGKSRLLDEARDHAGRSDSAVLAIGGVEAESQLPFAGLHRLLQPILGGVDDLPAPQRAALAAAFGMTDEAAPDLFLIALAALELLADAAAGAPLLVVVEDAQWLDRPTCDVLGFVARRLAAEPIGLLVAVREGSDSGLTDAGLPELAVAELDAAAAEALLDASAPELPAELRTRLLREAAGNPLALMELPVALDGDLRDGEPPPLTDRLEKAFAARGSALPDATRSLLLVAAADDGGDLGEVLRAAARLARGAADEALVPAVEARLIEVDGDRLRFRHPLVRSAVYQAATLGERRAAHAALGEILADQPDRRAWHRAAAIGQPDETVAAELEVAGLRAERRGAVAVAVLDLERAARLSDDPVRRTARLLRAAELAFELGRHEVVQRLVDDAERRELGPHEQARIAWIRESFFDGAPGDAAHVRSLVALAEAAAAAGDADLALKLLRAAALRTWWSDPGDGVREQVFDAAEAVGVDELDPRLLAALGLAAPDHLGPVVLERLSRIAPGDVTDPVASWLLGMAAHARGAPERSTVLLAAAARLLRSQGRLALLAQVLVMQAWDEIHLGNWNGARTAADEGLRLARETAQPAWTAKAQIAQALLLGVAGDEQRAEDLADEAEGVILAHQLGSLVGVLQLARGLTALTAGRHEAAYDHLRRMFDPADAAFVRRECYGEIVYFAEAATQTGRRDEAVELIATFGSLGALTGSPGICKAVVFARPLLVGARDSGDAFDAALQADGTRWPFFRARVQLAYGSWLRRQHRSAESRAPLRAARETFDALRATPWADRARVELRASGETIRVRAPEARDDLTPQELQIAALAARGLSNREIAQQIYLSHRTVASHLYRIFPKLGVTSRGQLRGALPELAELSG